MFPVATQTHNHWNRIILAALSVAANDIRSAGGAGRADACHRGSSGSSAGGQTRDTPVCSCPVKDGTTRWVHLVKHLLSGRQNHQEAVNASNSCDRQMTSRRVLSLKAAWGRGQREESWLHLQEVNQEAKKVETPLFSFMWNDSLALCCPLLSV